MRSATPSDRLRPEALRPLELRRISRAAARFVDRDPDLSRRALSPPDPIELLRAPDDNEAAARQLIRQTRRHLIVWAVASEASGASPLEIAAQFSDVADATLDLADRVAYRETVARAAPPVDEAGAPVGRAILGLGKLGSRELNPSSDVDLLFVYGTDRGQAGELSLHELFVRWVRRVRSVVADIDDDGFGFRVDLDLRPEGTKGPLVNSVDALETYYERFGATWERAAMLRLRPVVDRLGVGVAVMRRLRPFVFPRSPDPRMLESLSDMRARIEATAPDALDDDGGFDVKRSWGGIRDVEFRVQATQMLHAGRLPVLRQGTTAELISQLEAHGLLEHRAAYELARGYEFLRRLEHALQYDEDRQTQLYPSSGEARQRAAALCRRGLGPRPGPPGPESTFDGMLASHRRAIRRRYDELFSEHHTAAEDRVSPQALLALDRTARPEQRLEALSRLGFHDPDAALGFVEQLERRPASPFHPGRQAAVHGARRLAAALLAETAESTDPLGSIGRLPDVFSGRQHTTSLSPFIDNRRLVRLLVRVLAVSPHLSRLLIRGPGRVSTILLGPARRRRSRPRLREQLCADDGMIIRAGGDDDDEDERALSQMRRIHGAESLRIALGFLDGRLTVVEAGHRLSVVADAVLDRALELGARRLRRRYGDIAGLRACVLGLGRLGGRELGFSSDLDLLFVYDGDGESDGPRTIGAGEWAARLAQQTVWALSAPLAEGRCYEVDTRLRPSGSQGPLCVRLSQFVRYHEEGSALWERQALLKSRPVAGDATLQREAKIAAKAAALRQHPSDALRPVGDVLLEMRARMTQERAMPGFDLKLSEGGLADIEFCVQGLLLRHGPKQPALVTSSTRRALRRLARAGVLTEERRRALEEALDWLSTLREAVALVDDGQPMGLSPHDWRLERLARMGGVDLGAPTADGLYAEVLRRAADVRELTSRLLLRT